MIISFETQDLQRICCHIDVAESELGPGHAGALTTALADIEAFATAAEVLEFWAGEAELHADDSLSIAVGPVYVATFVPVGARIARDEHGEVDWTSVTRLKILNLREQS